MLDLVTIDLDDIVQGLEDHSYEPSWWFDARSGEVRYHSRDVDEESTEDLEEAGLILIGPLLSQVGYTDMQDFIELIGERRPADMLARAIQGRGAFRRFKDTLLEFPELREQWFRFHDARMRRRAIEWLVDHDLVEDASAAAAYDQHRDPPVGGPIVTLARAVSEDLRELYGDRLVDVLVFGSHARGDATDESDLDLLVVVDEVTDRFAELDRMEPVLWRHTDRTGVVVTAVPVSAARFAEPDEPLLVNAKAEAVAA